MKIEMPKEEQEQLSYVNMRFFGARGDSANDDTLPIQAAIDFASVKGSPAKFSLVALYMIKCPAILDVLDESIVKILVTRDVA